MGAEEQTGPARQAGDPAALAARLFRDMGGALELLTVYLGERLGLYQALHAGGPATSAELAARTGTSERYIREWLEHHAASGLRRFAVRSRRRRTGRCVRAHTSTSRVHRASFLRRFGT